MQVLVPRRDHLHPIRNEERGHDEEGNNDIVYCVLCVCFRVVNND